MLFTNLLTIIYFASGIFSLLLAWLIVRENPRQAVNRILSVLLFFAAFAPILTAFGFLIESSESISPDSQTLQTAFIIWEFFFPQLFLFSLVFPTQNKILKSHPRIYIFLYLPPAFHILLVSLFDSGEQINTLIDAENLLPMLGIIFEPIRFMIRFFLSIFSLLRDYHAVYFGVNNILYIGAALTIMHFSYARIRTYRLRKQVRLVLWGIRVSTGLYAIAFLLPEVLRLEVAWWQSHLLTAIGLILGISAIAWAIIRHQFLDIQYIIRRGFIVSATSGLLAGAYLLFYGHVNRVANLTFGENALFVETFLLIFTVIAFQPVLNLIEWVVDRLFGKGLGDSRDALQKLSREVLTLLDANQLRDRIVNGLSESMLLEVVYLLLPGEDHHFSTPTPGEHHQNYVLPGGCDIAKVLATEQKPVYLNEFFPQHLDDAYLKNSLRLRIHLFIPLCHRNRLLGILAVGRKITHTSFSLEEQNLLSLLADQVAISLENIQLYLEKIEKERYEKEIAVAKEIQQLLLPQRVPQNAKYELCAINIPSREIGGDYYDFIEMPDDLLGIAIGDVSGKGIPGAILMSNLQAVFRASALQNTSPKKVVSQVNNHLAASISSEKYVTFLYGILDVSNRKFTFTNAGHNFPLLYRDLKVEAITGADLIVGVRPNCQYQQRTLRLNPGDLMLLYTDGITEAIDADEKLFGEQRLMDLIQKNSHASVKNLVEIIFEDVYSYTGREQFDDDLTIVLLRIH